MPKEYSRILLEVTNIRVERVQGISLEDAWAEGLTKDGYPKLWNSINEKRGFGWDQNPWVWVVEFKAVCEAIRHAREEFKPKLLTDGSYD
jgi:hypothetical protein